MIDLNFAMKLWKALGLDKMTDEERKNLNNFLDNEFQKIEKKVKKNKKALDKE